MTLASGEKVQTGTMATLMHNIKLYGAETTTEEEKAQLEKETEIAIPLLSKLSMFKPFGVGEWKAGGKDGPLREGKMFVGRKAREMGLGE